MDPVSPSLNDTLSFLLSLFNQGLGYSAINSARSALSTCATIDGQPVGQHPLVCRFLKSVFNQRPALPKYNVTWDTDVVLKYLKQLSPCSKLTVKLLSHKLVMLFLLLAGQRCQTVHLYDVRNMDLTSSSVTFTIGDLTKTSTPRSHIGQVSYKP
jgi:hypothetical protein